MRSQLYPSPWAALQANSSTQPTGEEEILGLIEEELKKSARKGFQRLLAGEVTPGEAAKNAKQMGLPFGPQPSPTPEPGPTPSPTPGPAPLAARLSPLLTGAPAVSTGGAKGMTAEAEVEANQKAASTRQAMLTLTPEQLAIMKKMAMGINPETGAVDPTDPYQQAQAGIGKLESMLAAMTSQSPQVDLSPLMALSDSLTGGKTLAGYTKPKDQSAAILAYADDIQKRKAEQSKYVVDAVKGMKAGTQTDLLQAILLEKFGNKAEDPTKSGPKAGRPSIEVDRFTKGFEAIDEVKSAKERVNKTEGIMPSLEALGKKWLTDKMLQSTVINAAQLYPISNLDVQQFNGDPSLIERLNAMTTRLVKGENFTAHDRKTILEYVIISRKKAAALVEQAKGDYADTVGAEYGYTPEKARNLLRAFTLTGGMTKASEDAYNKKYPPKGATKASKAPEGKVLMISPDGKRGYVPKAQEAAALQQGYKKAE